MAGVRHGLPPWITAVPEPNAELAAQLRRRVEIQNLETEFKTLGRVTAPEKRKMVEAIGKRKRTHVSIVQSSKVHAKTDEGTGLMGSLLDNLYTKFIIALDTEWDPILDSLSALESRLSSCILTVPPSFDASVDIGQECTSMILSQRNAPPEALATNVERGEEVRASNMRGAFGPSCVNATYAPVGSNEHVNNADCNKGMGSSKEGRIQ
ncbi:hypothetical protein NDU88_002775 [Pleurodeles waltl]|uniref:Uncharacterized protein n=1 Tax=Pleurodeles waltl TaxID=8319 RepID=A0AAV7SE42_PLEWA|nr:hypothetical protein NDU88_002775 [Pleurodeles waltl]